MHRARGGFSAPQSDTSNRYPPGTDPRHRPGSSSRYSNPPSGFHSRSMVARSGPSRFPRTSAGTASARPPIPGYRGSHRATPYRVTRNHAQPHGQPRHQVPHVPQEDPAAPSRASPGLCQVCSSSDKQIYHKHFSSLRLRQILDVENSDRGYMCPSCKSRHRSYPETRVKMVVSDSTLHEFFAPPGYTGRIQYKGDTMHADYVTIPGACMDTLFHAFKLDCDLLPPDKPIDVVLVMGYNDLVKGHSRYWIMECLQCFCRYVSDLAQKNHPDSPNTVAIATFMYPPQLAWLYDNGPEPLNYVNEKEKIDWLNAQIHELNMKNLCEFYPRFHTYGIRTSTRSTTDMYGNVKSYHVKLHRWEHWREQDRANMLHLRNDRRFKMGRAVNNYFILRT